MTEDEMDVLVEVAQEFLAHGPDQPYPNDDRLIAVLARGTATAVLRHPFVCERSRRPHLTRVQLTLGASWSDLKTCRYHVGHHRHHPVTDAALRAAWVLGGDTSFGLTSFATPTWRAWSELLALVQGHQSGASQLSVRWRGRLVPLRYGRSFLSRKGW